MPPTGNGESIRSRSRRDTAVDAQDGFWDHQWEDSGLEAALEERQRIKEQRADVQAEFKTADTAVKTKLEEYNLAVGEVARCGRFKIKKSQRAGAAVSFETSPREQLTIGTVDDYDE